MFLAKIRRYRLLVLYKTDTGNQKFIFEERNWQTLAREINMRSAPLL